MIACELKHLLERCQERGYTLDEVRPCIVSQDGDRIVVDESHPAFPRKPKVPPQTPAGASGPGTELKKLLRLVGIADLPNCSCNAHAAQMDAWGADECEARLDEIVGWLEQEAGNRGLPFVRFAAQKVVKLAIRRARAGAAS
jgi:hypothetical protein